MAVDKVKPPFIEQNHAFDSFINQLFYTLVKVKLYA